MPTELGKVWEEVIRQFPVAVVILGTCLLCWRELRKSFEGQLGEFEGKLKLLERLLAETKAERDGALKELHKYLQKPSELRQKQTEDK